MSIIGIRAFFACDGCAEKMSFDLDPADKSVVGWSLHDHALDAARDGLVREFEGYSSVQGDHVLCPACTRIVDEATNSRATKDEVKAALDDQRDSDDYRKIFPRIKETGQ